MHTPFRQRSAEHRWLVLLALSGAASLAYEVVWFRRLSLILGGSAPAAAVTVGAFMAGLALGGLLSRRLDGHPARTYAALEGFAAAWSVAMPLLIAVVAAVVAAVPSARFVVGALVLIPPATALGATWPVVARRVGSTVGAGLYAANTGGAVLGVLGATFVVLPALGVRGTELVAAAFGSGAALLALFLAELPATEPEPLVDHPVSWRVLWWAAGLAGFAALGLEVAWMRLAAVALGATVQTMGLVLATFLATTTAGALVGRQWPADPARGLVWGLGGVAFASLLGASTWGLLPYGVAAIYGWTGPEGLSAATTILAAVAMGGAPAASGLAFTTAVRCAGPRIRTGAGGLYAANAVGSLLGAVTCGLWAVPLLEIRGAVALYAVAAAIAASLVARRPWILVAVVGLGAAIPSWDGKLYAVGIYLRVSDFVDLSPGAVRTFADEGWDLLFYDQGTTGAVAVGRSQRTGNVWMSINGKVDASTGADMPTQRWSGVLPVRMATREVEDVLVVGLASGVTAGAVLGEPGIRSLTVLELEPVVVGASAFFAHVNGRPLEDPRTTLVLDDARAWLDRSDRQFDVIVSEPSNPWITGVSSLFTLEYHQIVRRRLRPGGVACQWVQLYGMGTDELRGLLRTFLAVFPDAVLFETIAGSDLLLVGGDPQVVDGLPIQPLLDADGIRRAAGDGWLNTDDHPRVEWQAPRWLHYPTGERNHRLLEGAER